MIRIPHKEPILSICRLRHFGEMTVCVCVIVALAVVTLTACILLRPIGILIERSAAKERKRHNDKLRHGETQWNEETTRAQQLENELRYLLELVETNLEVADDLRVQYAKRLISQKQDGKTQA